MFTGRRKGANEIIANALLMNNNLFLANVDSLMYCLHNLVKTLTSSLVNSQTKRSKP